MWDVPQYKAGYTESKKYQKECKSSILYFRSCLEFKVNCVIILGSWTFFPHHKYTTVAPRDTKKHFYYISVLWTQSRSQEQWAGSSTNFPASFLWATSNGTDHHIWELAGGSSVCNKHFLWAPATAKLQAKVLGVSRSREGWISQRTEHTVSPLSILLHRSMIPGKAAEGKEINHWRYAFLWAMEHCQVWIQKEEFLTSLPVIQREPCAHMAPECPHVKMTRTLAKTAIPHPTWASPSLLGIVQCYFNRLPGWQQPAAGSASGALTVLCSSPSRMRNVCSNTVYMILPMPNEGSMTFGMISSTATQNNTHHH